MNHKYFFNPIRNFSYVPGVSRSEKRKGLKMGKKQIPKPTDSELEILGILWQNGESTVKTVNEKLNEKKETGYTTTLKMLQIMFEKNLVERDENERSHLYKSAIDQNKIQKILLDKLLETAFSGSAANLVMQVLGNSQPSKEELKNIKELLDKIERERK
jgi:BlaI family penicillinase repressor